jgi:hypothetical protein
MIELSSKVKWVEIDNRPYLGKWYVWPEREIRACVTKDDGKWWHVSVSHRQRYPNWREIYQAWYDLVPGAGSDFEGAIILPRKTEYVNLHPNCFHVFQLPEWEMPGLIQVDR